MDEILAMQQRQIEFFNSMNTTMRKMNYSFEDLKESSQNLKYTTDLEKFVEEKLEVTRPGECEEKINAMDTEQFVVFYKKIIEDWESRKRKYSNKRKPMTY